MAFDVNQFVKQQTQNAKKTGGFDVDKFVKQQTQTTQGAGFDVNKFLISQGIQPKVDLGTPEGLKTQAEFSGLGKEAERIIGGKGEDPKKFFSGGFISDTFDVLNMLQYGVTGLLKGKSFNEGVKTRQSFSDKDALGDFGLPGVVAGIALDIAVDPLTYIAPVTLVKKIPGAVKAIRAGKEAVEATSLGQKLGRTFVYRFGQDPVYKELAERTTKNVGIGSQNLLDIARPLTKLDSATQKVIATARKAGKLDTLPAEVLSKAKPAFDELDRLGQEAVNVGLLKAETYQENVGKYIARLYKTKEAPDAVQKVKGLFEAKPLRADLSRFMKRSDIPEDVRQAMGEILEAGYPTAKALVQLNQAIERTKFFGEVATKWGTDIAEEGMQQLPNTKRLGVLAGKFVPEPIYDDIQEIIRTKTDLEKSVSMIVAGFKFGKVVMNPATHSRNIMSNLILNHFEGLNPARVDIYIKAAKELKNKGPLYQEARKLGLGLDTSAANEIKSLLLGPEGKALGKLKSAANKISDLYQKEEEFAKMAQYIFQRGKGLASEEAWKVAERATFNYAQVTPFIRRLRESAFGFPFITFTYKVTPQVAKTLATKPTKISNIGKIKTAIENQADLPELTAERASEPDWIRDGFYVKLPIKDEHGRSAYLDLTYILPFGDLISGQLIERGIQRETGLPEGVAQAGLRKAPFLNLIRELARNQDFYGNKVWKDTATWSEQLGDLMRHLTKTYMPPLIADQIPGGYRATGERREGTLQRAIGLDPTDIESGGAQSRTLMQEMLRQVGLKIQPIDLETQEKFSENEIRKALETLLLEEGEAAQFKRVFIPKD